MKITNKETKETLDAPIAPFDDGGCTEPLKNVMSENVYRNLAYRMFFFGDSRLCGEILYMYEEGGFLFQSYYLDTALFIPYDMVQSLELIGVEDSHQSLKDRSRRITSMRSFDANLWNEHQYRVPEKDTDVRIYLFGKDIIRGTVKYADAAGILLHSDVLGDVYVRHTLISHQENAEHSDLYPEKAVMTEDMVMEFMEREYCACGDRVDLFYYDRESGMYLGRREMDSMEYFIVYRDYEADRNKMEFSFERIYASERMSQTAREIAAKWNEVLKKSKKAVSEFVRKEAGKDSNWILSADELAGRIPQTVSNETWLIIYDEEKDSITMTDDMDGFIITDGVTGERIRIAYNDMDSSEQEWEVIQRVADIWNQIVIRNLYEEE